MSLYLWNYHIHTLDESVKFEEIDIKRLKQERPLSLDLICLPLSYDTALPINLLKKWPLLCLIDEDCHEFYKNLKIHNVAQEFDKIKEKNLSA